MRRCVDLGNAMRAVHTVGDDSTRLCADFELSQAQAFVSGRATARAVARSTGAIEQH